MKNREKTIEQFDRELKEMQKRISGLEVSEAELKKVEARRRMGLIRGGCA